MLILVSFNMNTRWKTISIMSSKRKVPRWAALGMRINTQVSHAMFLHICTPLHGDPIQVSSSLLRGSFLLIICLDWSRFYAGGAEIRQHIKDRAKKFGIEKNFNFNSKA